MIPVLWKERRRNAFYLDLQVVPWPVAKTRFTEQCAIPGSHTSDPMQSFSTYLLSPSSVPDGKDILKSKENRIPAFKAVTYQKTDKMRRRVARKPTTRSTDLGRETGEEDIHFPLL